MLALTLAVGACATGAGNPDDDVERAKFTLRGEQFRLELALDDPTRMKGMGGREHIPPDGGMLFVFPDAARRAFVMRDCPIPIDLVFLDDNGVVVAIHAMTPEAPRGPEEDPFEYEARLRQYPSRFPVRYAAEFAGGRLAEIGAALGDKAEFDRAALKERAR